MRGSLRCVPWEYLIGNNPPNVSVIGKIKRKGVNAVFVPLKGREYSLEEIEFILPHLKKAQGENDPKDVKDKI